jgi:hypothetical protein
MKTKELTFELPENYSGCIVLNEQQMEFLGITEDTEEIRGECKTVGPWQVLRSYKALCEASEWINTGYGQKRRAKVTFFGVRTMGDIKECGYGIEGRVSVKGKKYTCYDTTQMFMLPSGKLVNVATIGVREIYPYPHD